MQPCSTFGLRKQKRVHEQLAVEYRMLNRFDIAETPLASEKKTSSPVATGGLPLRFQAADDTSALYELQHPSVHFSLEDSRIR